MNGCELALSPDIELYFYGELEDLDRRRVEAHLRKCERCRQCLEELHLIRRVLEGHRIVEAPPGGDWSGFMRRLESTVSGEAGADRYRAGPRFAPSTLYQAAAFAAMVAIATLGIVIASRVRHAPLPAARPESAAVVTRKAPDAAAVSRPAANSAAVSHLAPNAADAALRHVSAEHLERSKLVVLSLATLDPRQTRASDWQYERQLAGELLDDTRLYRQVAQEHGMTDVARVMRDLETVLIETSMSDTSDRDALPRVQRLIAKRDLVVKMRLAAAN
jgi:hypothetical protein